MENNYSYQTSPAKTETSDSKEDRFSGLEEQNMVSEPADTETTFLSVMSQYEMEILTSLFPKCAQTLAAVLRNRPQHFEDEL
jgi:hypothetical protein